MRQIFALLLLAALPAAMAQLPLRDGEAFTFKISWAILPGAGEIKVSAATDRSGPAPRLVVSTTTRTRGLARVLLPFDAQADSFFDQGSGRLVALTESSEQRNKQAAHSVTFDYPAAQALYTRILALAGAKEPEQCAQLRQLATQLNF